jgi:predicted AAA+ superfamily ATPase
MVESALLAALSDTPVTLLVGARQSGKSTLVQRIADGPHPAIYRTLDDADTLAAARRDPTAFVAVSQDRPLVIDEVQRAPELLLAIKAAVDRDRRPGRFLLTGSANLLTLPRVAESLAGRVDVQTLWPLAQTEIAERPRPEGIVRLFGDSDLPDLPAAERSQVIQEVLRGGLPPAVERADRDRRAAWFQSYLTTVTQRDVLDLANVAHAIELPRLLHALALRMTQPLNKNGLAATLGLAYSTLDRYLALLELLYVIHRVPAWHGNRGKRLVRAPKLLISDSGFAGHLLGATPDVLDRGTVDLGALVEAFVGMELVRLAAVDRSRAAVHHYRTHTRAEVDYLLETPDGRIVGVAVKAGATVGADDFRHLAGLRDLVGRRFVRGVVLHLGERALPFGDRLAAWPITALWA